MFDFPTILCCLNYANIYCLEITCLMTTTSLFPLNYYLQNYIQKINKFL